MSLISIIFLIFCFGWVAVQLALLFNANATTSRPRNSNGQYVRDIGITYTSLRKSYKLNY